MTTKSNNNNNDDNNIETPNAENCLQLSKELDQAIQNLLTMSQFRVIAQTQGKDIATMEAVKFLREHSPQLFNKENPGDGLAMLYAGMD
jgi:hypothetical protein